MIVVTGGAGFIGCNLIRRLNKLQQKNILVVDDLKNGEKYINLKDLYIFDFLDKNYFMQRLLNDFVNSYIKNIDVVFHEGACSSTIEWDGRYMMDNNYQYSKDLLHYCIKYNIPFIYASSAAVYGNNQNFFCNVTNYICEKPVSMYGYSKYLFDQYVKTVLSRVTSQICGLRYFNVYGPYESHKHDMASVIFGLYKQIMHDKYPTLFIGSKYFKRDFIHVEDIVDINIWVWDHCISGIFDCGTGIANSFERVADIVLKFFKKNLFKYVPMPVQLCKQYQTFTRANIHPLRNIGYKKSFIDIQNGIFKYLHWLISNE